MYPHEQLCSRVPSPAHRLRSTQEEERIGEEKERGWAATLVMLELAAHSRLFIYGFHKPYFDLVNPKPKPNCLMLKWIKPFVR